LISKREKGRRNSDSKTEEKSVQKNKDNKPVMRSEKSKLFF
jgi:hypothetical protein